MHVLNHLLPLNLDLPRPDESGQGTMLESFWESQKLLLQAQAEWTAKVGISGTPAPDASPEDPGNR